LEDKEGKEFIPLSSSHTNQLGLSFINYRLNFQEHFVKILGSRRDFSPIQLVLKNFSEDKEGK
jgi:hypothetical protein